MVLCAAVGCGALVFAQGTAPVPPAIAQLQARQEVFVMEGILDGAVGYASQAVARKVAQGPVQEMLLAGVTRTRGFRLDGYGIFFDVEFPVVREAVSRMMWNVQSTPEAAQAISTALQSLSHDLDAMAQEGDPRARQELQQRMKAFETQIKPYLVTAGNRGDRVTVTGTPVSAYVDDVQDAYAQEIRRSLTEAILDHAAPLNVGADEWLTVAARASQGRMLVPGDSTALGGTLVLRIKGHDLSALREGRLSKDEARKRVEVKQY
jgi:hypothetical protein